MKGVSSRGDTSAGQGSAASGAGRVLSTPAKAGRLSGPLGVGYLVVLCAALSIVIALASVVVLVLDLDNDPTLLILGGVGAVVVTSAVCSYVVWKLLHGHQVNVEDRANQQLRLDTAINSMHQGLAMFDS